MTIQSLLIEIASGFEDYRRSRTVTKNHDIEVLVRKTFPDELTNLLSNTQYLRVPVHLYIAYVLCAMDVPLRGAGSYDPRTDDLAI